MDNVPSLAPDVPIVVNVLGDRVAGHPSPVVAGVGLTREQGTLLIAPIVREVNTLDLGKGA